MSEDLSFFWSSPDFGQKIGRNLSEDLFFWSSTDFGQKFGLILGEIIFILNFVLLKFFEFSGSPPPLQNPAYATGGNMLFAAL